MKTRQFTAYCETCQFDTVHRIESRRMVRKETSGYGAIVRDYETTSECTVCTVNTHTDDYETEIKR